MAKRKALPAWFRELDLRESLLVWLGSAQSRYESAAISAFGDRFSAKEIRRELRALQHDRHIMLMEFDRVRWAVQISGRNAARVARSRAQKAAA